jgi:hypothetical protein
MHDCVGLSLYAFMQTSVCLIYPLSYLIKAPVRTQAYRFFFKYTRVSFFAVLPFSSASEQTFRSDAVLTIFNTTALSMKSLLWSTTSNVTYAAAMGHQPATTYEPAHRIGVVLISCLYCNDYTTKNCTSLLHTYYNINIQHIITDADVINPNMDFTWTECLYVGGNEIKWEVLRRRVIMAWCS